MLEQRTAEARTHLWFEDRLTFSVSMSGLALTVSGMWLVVPETTLVGAVFMAFPYYLFWVAGFRKSAMRGLRLVLMIYGAVLIIPYEWAMRDYFGTMVGTHPSFCPNALIVPFFWAHAISLLTAGLISAFARGKPNGPPIEERQEQCP